MSQIDIKTDKLNQCECGSKPEHYTVGYSRTPYDVSCPGCGKQTSLYDRIGGAPDNIIDFWNKLAPLKELKKDDGSLRQVFVVDNETFEGNGILNKMRRFLLDTSMKTYEDTEIYVLFKNGKIRKSAEFVKSLFIQGVDY